MALEQGIITEQSSPQVLLYDISRHWRELLDATNFASLTLVGWNEKEDVAAELSVGSYLSPAHWLYEYRAVDQAEDRTTPKFININQSPFRNKKWMYLDQCRHSESHGQQCHRQNKRRP